MRLLVLLLLGCLTCVQAAPVKVYILAGQSNMEGHAKVETFGYIGEDPATAPLLKKMLQADGSPIVCENAYISYFTGRGDENGVGSGKLTAGYGSRSNPAEDGGKIGPEFLFGITMDEAHDEPVLIIKTAWGGKSLYYDYRPPSAGPFIQSEKDKEKDRNHPDQAGHYYRLMMQHIKTVTADIGKVIPDYDESQGYELAGFVWFQGWNDMVNRDIYPYPPKEQEDQRFVQYGEWLGMLIKDMRKELSTPEMPAVIGVMGVGGKVNEKQTAFRSAMEMPVNDPDLKGSVVAVQTSEFWDEPLGVIDEKRNQVRQMSYLLRTENKNHANADGSMDAEQQKAYLEKFRADLISEEDQARWDRGASNAGYHYLGCAKTFARMGEAFAQALLELE
ncbi:MAG: sialate O-acetylesterase [Verrucomicrobiota bacterium]